MRTRVHYRWLAVLIVAIALLALPMAASAQDGDGTGTGGSAELTIPGIFSMLLGSGGTTEEGAIAVGPMQFDLAALNSTTKVEGLTLGNGEFDWGAVTISQNQPVGSPALMISDSQATVGGPSSGYTSTATAHVSVQPNYAVQGDATVGITYDGMARRMGVMIGNGNLTANTVPVGVELQNVNTGSGTLTADRVLLTAPAAGASVDVNGFQTGSAGMSFDSLTISGPEVQLGNAAKLSDLTLIVHGPAEGYATEGAVTVELKAGDLASAQAQIGLMYDPYTRQFVTAMGNGSASVTTDALTIQLSGISYIGSTLNIDAIDFALPGMNIDGQISGVTMGGGSALSFEQAWLRYVPDPAAGGSFNGTQVSIQHVDGSYLVTSQVLLTPGGGE